MLKKGLLLVLFLLIASVSFGQQATVEAARNQGLLPYLAFCLTGGLLSLLTPCVFPMVPVTVSFFSKREKGRALPEALSYTFGIIGTFTLLGVGASLILGAAGILNFATNPWVNLALAVLFILMALNLFGLFEIKLPTGLMNKTGKQSGKGGLIGPFFMGMTFAMTSFTCTAPIAGSLLAAASKGEILYPLLGMTTYGAAFAAPFFFLAMFPSAMTKLPRSGEWMNVVKPALGFIELAAAFKFLSNADLGLQLGWITRPVFLVAWSLIFLGLALYLLGLPNFKQKLGLTRRIIGAASLAFSGVLLLGIQQWPLGFVNSFPPPDPYPLKTDSMAQKQSKSTQASLLEKKGRIEAKTFEEALDIAQKTGRSVFVDFTGVTCINCRLMEKNVFPEPDVKTELDKMVTVQLYTDRPNPEDEANKKLQSKLANNIALPTYVLVKPDGTVIDKYEGLSPTSNEFATFLKKATS